MGLYNRRRFERDLPELSVGTTADVPLSIIIFDLDGFKQVNDAQGHPVGDEVLKVVALQVKASCSGKGSCYRWGGDEIAILLKNYSVGEATALGERIRSGIEHVALAWHVTASVGVACFPESTVDPTQLLNLADKAMYESKHAGGNRLTKAASRNSDQQSAAPRLAPEQVQNRIGAFTLHAANDRFELLAPEQVQNRIAAVDLELFIQQGTGENFIVLVENKSDETVTVKKIKISHDGVKLAETPPPGAKDGWALAPRVSRQIEWNAKNPDPASKLMDLLRTYTGSSQAILGVEIQAEVLGRLKTCHSRIHVQVEPGSKRVWQL